jgi:archaeal flagellar protein FlaI
MSEILKSYGDVRIYSPAPGCLPLYVQSSPKLTEDEKKLLNDPVKYLGDTSWLMNEVSEIPLFSLKEKRFMEYISEKVNSMGIKIENREYVLSSLIDRLFWRYGLIGPLIRDDELEEVMVNGVGNKIFVFHREVGMCETELSYDSSAKLNELVDWLSLYSNRNLSRDNPLLDCHMPDGSRGNVAVSPAAPFGPAVTIRKFKANPLTILDLIESGTLTCELAAFLWVSVEGFRIKPLDMILSGGAGAGKTTLLNALAMLIPQDERIVTVEDTMELNFSFIKNWVPLEASPSETDPTRPLSMHSLLKNSLRMRPDRVIVGEVRGVEAETLFVAMDIGLDGNIATIHANNARETIIRLGAEPMDVPLRMLTLLNLVVVLNRITDRKRGVLRRVTQVAEVSGIEGDVVQLGDIFSYDIANDKIKRTEYPIILLDKMARECGLSKKRIQTEFLIREKIIQHMLDENIRDPRDVREYVQKYYAEPKTVLEELRSQ